LAFFPIDTLKTRLQAKGGFFANGGWRGIYRGLGSCVVALAPLAALFFVTYDTMKRRTAELGVAPAVLHMASALCGEVAACLVRVPAEVIKQRTQAGHRGVGGALLLWANLRWLLQDRAGEGTLRGLYRGWNTTIMREIPFTMIQFPLYEWLKAAWARRLGDQQLLLARGAICGSLAGAVAAAATTPLDVVKTRIMLHRERVGVAELVRTMVREEGYSVFWSGVGPRTMWIGAGGAIFLGCYEMVLLSLR
jgi:solute carrier family 25 S-adenosylmethionine transporter 26